MSLFRSALSLLVLSVFGGAAISAPVEYIESTDGTLSGASFAPTELGVFDIGTNVVRAGLNDGTGQHEVYSFIIGADTELVGITLTMFEDGSGVPIPSDRMFYAFDDEEFFPLSPGDLNGANGDEFLGGALIGLPADLNTNLIERLGQSQFGIGSGYTPPLPEGTYTVFAQQTGGQNTQYRMEFQVASVSAVPEPSTSVALLLMGFAACTRRRRR